MWPYVVHDAHGRTGVKGTVVTRLTFFAVDNVQGRGDPVLTRLLDVLQASLELTATGH